MTAKKRAKKSVPPAPRPTRLPSPDADPEGDVAVVQMRDGSVAFRPRWVRELEPEAREMCVELQEQSAIASDLLDSIDQTARDLREHVGLSWERLGWLMGMSGEGVRRRLSENDG